MKMRYSKVEKSASKLWWQKKTPLCNSFEWLPWIAAVKGYFFTNDLTQMKHIIVGMPSILAYFITQVIFQI